MANLLVARRKNISANSNYGNGALQRKRPPPVSDLFHEPRHLKSDAVTAKEANGVEKKGEREDVKRDDGGRRLLFWSELPSWQKHGSELIHGGYRKACGSVKGCLHSWTYLHNETVNIFSHVVGALVFFGLPLYVFAAGAAPRYAIAEPTDIVACTVYLLGVAACFVLSAIFHTFMSHSERAYRLGMRLDVHGILVLMWSATVPLLRYNFACRPGLGAAYLGLTSALALLCSAATSWPRFSGPRLGHVRAALLGAFGAGSFVAPIAHGMLLDGVAAQSERIAAPWILLTVLFNGAGVAAYTLKFPERWFPRRFDLFGASHQIMHVMVVLAALAFSAAVLQAFDFSHGQGAVC